jgi:hypothetical protein
MPAGGGVQAVSAAWADAVIKKKEASIAARVEWDIGK